MVQEEIEFKDTSYIKLCPESLLLSRVEPFVHFGKGHYKEQFCEIILNLDQWFRAR